MPFRINTLLKVNRHVLIQGLLHYPSLYKGKKQYVPPLTSPCAGRFLGSTPVLSLATQAQVRAHKRPTNKPASCLLANSTSRYITTI